MISLRIHNKPLPVDLRKLGFDVSERNTELLLNERGVVTTLTIDDVLGVFGLYKRYPPKTFTRPVIIESINKSVLELAEQFLDSGIRGRS